MEYIFQLRITCNPFLKEIRYEYLENGQYINIADRKDDYCSELINDKYIHTAFQSRACEIVEIIDREFNNGKSGLKILFIGNKEDYDVLENVIASYFPNNNIICEKDSSYYLAAPYVMSEIEDNFTVVESKLRDKDYISDEVTDEIAKYKDTIDESIAVCVTGLYSAGKSAFINSLIGHEILPSSSDPTTAKVFKIMTDERYTISFPYNNIHVEVCFNGSNYSISEGCPAVLSEEIRTAFSNQDNNEARNIYKLLSAINRGQLSDIGERVDITLPFHQATFLDSHYRFVIYDTPGSNSDSNKRHFEILKESLGKQTNALLVLLTTPDTMDSTDNNNLLSLIEDTGKSLDTYNAVIVVNKADMLAINSLSSRKDNYQSLKITKWKSTRIFFLSSVLALASKKVDPDNPYEWMDEDAYETYDEKCRKFIRGDRKLYEYNIVDRSKMSGLSPAQLAMKDNALYINSGLAAVENEIADYSLRYALYNKCSRANDYLKGAIQYCSDTVSSIERQRDEELTSTQTLFDDRQRQLAEALDNAQETTLKERSQEFQRNINQQFIAFKSKEGLAASGIFWERKLRIYKDFEKEWNNILSIKTQQQFSMDEAFIRIQSKIKYRYNAVLNAFSASANRYINEYWKKATEDFKSTCRSIISDSDVLTPEQKAIMDPLLINMESMTREVVEFDLRSIHAVRKDFFGNDKFDNSTCCKNFATEFNNVVTREIVRVCSDNSRYFEQWSKELISCIKMQLCTFNSELHEMELKIEELNKIIAEKKADLELLNKTRDHITNLLEIQKG